MNLIFMILCFSVLLFEGRSELIFKCSKMLSKDTVLLNENDQLDCTCSDTVNPYSRIYFILNYLQLHPTSWKPTDDELSVKRSYDNKTITLRKNKVSFGDEGYYKCYNEEHFYGARIYIWVQTKKHFFSTMPFRQITPIFLSSIRVPCVPTSPCYDVKLFVRSKELTIDRTNGIEFNPRDGFSISNIKYFYAPITFNCSITMYGRTESVLYRYVDFDQVEYEMIN